MYEIRGTRTGKRYGKAETYPTAEALAAKFRRVVDEPVRIVCPRV